MTEERAKALTEYLSKDADRTEQLFDMNIEDAVKEINADGYDFTAEELSEFADAMVKISDKKDSGELSDEELEDVSGGCGISLGFWLTIIAIYGWWLAEQMRRRNHWQVQS